LIAYYQIQVVIFPLIARAMISSQVCLVKVFIANLSFTACGPALILVAAASYKKFFARLRLKLQPQYAINGLFDPTTHLTHLSLPLCL
jgi:hypothetical protein